MITQEKKIAIAKRLAALPADKRAVLTERLAAEGIDVWQLPIVAAEPELPEHTIASAPEHSSENAQEATQEHKYYPLSFAQQRLWFIDQLATEPRERAQYNLFFGLQFHGELRTDWLQTAFNEIVSRHDVLRMQVVAQDGVGKQRIRPFEAFSIEQIPLPTDAGSNTEQSNTDQSSTDQSSIEKALQTLAQQQSAQPFDLTQDTLYRFTLVQVNAQHHVGLFTVHHMVFDAWSIDNLVLELTQCYQALASTAHTALEKQEKPEKQEAQLPELAIQYQDFATWQRRWSDSPAYQQQVNYWQQQLANAPAQLQLSIEQFGSEQVVSESTNQHAANPHAANQHSNGAEISQQFTAELSQNLNALAQAQGTTLYITLLAAFNLLLARYENRQHSGDESQSDICIGTSIANRPRLETEPLLGYFVNTLVMRNRVDEQQAFSAFLQQVNTVATDAYANQDLPFDHLLDVLQVDRQQARSPLFQVMFVMNNGAGNTELQLPGVTLSGFEKPLEQARFDLTLRITETSDSNTNTNTNNSAIRCDLEFNTQLFNQDDMQQLLAHYQQLLSQLCAAPNAPMAQSSLLSWEDSAALVKSVHADTQQPTIEEPAIEDKTTENLTSVHAQFEHWAATTPNELALTCIEERTVQQLSYDELNQRANQLAHVLIERFNSSFGVSNNASNTELKIQEPKVALLLDRSTHLIVAMLASLKAGAAYVPLDAKWPASRIATVLADCQAELLISDSQHVSLIDESLTALSLQQTPTSISTLMLDNSATDKLLAQQPKQNPDKNHESANKESTSDTSTSDKSTNNSFHSNRAAYLIYTSGSTGTPKGVVVEHQQLLAYSAGVMARVAPKNNQVLELSQKALRFASISTVAADLGNTAIYGALLFGGSLHLIDNDQAFDADTVANTMAEQQIDALKIVPSHLNGLLSSLAADPQQQARLLPGKILILGGEASPPSLISQIQQLAPTLRILNHYGPTETTVGALSYEIATAHLTSSLPIGKPLPGYTALVLDAQQNVCPVNVPGELYIGGAGVSRGYLEQTDLHQANSNQEKADPLAARFTALPKALFDLVCRISGDHSGDISDSAVATSAPTAMHNRWYRTGDKVRVLNNGNIEFIGRVDDQVKVRGYRVELGDIATAINALPEVAQAAVLLVPEESTSNTSESAEAQHLTAFLVAKNVLPETTLSDSVSNALIGKLPSYMVPERLLWLEKLPLNANGKVDRKALLALAQTHAEQSGSSQTESEQISEPQTEQQQMLADIWCGVLKKESVGIHDSFFNIGGDSILSLQVIARTKKAGYRLLPKQLFNHPTIAELAELMQPLKPKAETSVKIQEGSTSNGIVLNTITPAPKDAPIPLSFSQQRLWFLDQLQGSNSIYNMPMAVQMLGELQPSVLEQSFDVLIQRHAGLRTWFSSEGGVPAQHVATPEAFKAHFALGWHRVENETEAQQQVQSFAQQVFVLDAASPEHSPALFRAKVLAFAPTAESQRATDSPQDRQEPQKHWLLVNCHHSIADGWSLGLLVREFCQIYQALATNQPVTLPPHSIEYSDYAYWQHHVGQENYQQQLDYWQQQLHNTPARLDLPTDFARPAQQSYRGKHLPVTLDSPLSAQLKALATQQNVTLYTLLLSAWQVLLHRYSGQTDICTGSPVANRDLPETQSVVGFFANTIVLRGDLSGNPRFSDVVTQMHQVSIAAQANQDVPFEQLVDKLNVTRDPAYSPLFQVLFAWGVTQTDVQENIATPQGNIALSNVPNSAELLGTATSKFDLELSLRESVGESVDESVDESEKQIEGRLEFAADLFQPSTMATLWQHFTQLLQAVVANPEQPVGDIALITASELTQIERWNRSTKEHSTQDQSTQDQSTKDVSPQAQLLDQFTHMAAQHGEQIAASFVVSGQISEEASAEQNPTTQALTYSELDQKSTQLAQYLIHQGVQVGDTITVCQPRSLHMLVSLLAVLKAGAAYMPVDPNYPAARVQFMLQNANSRYVLTTAALQHSDLLNVFESSVFESSEFDNSSVNNKAIIAVDELALSNQQLADIPLPNVAESELAYLIYTSGSTGTPKAVQLTRDNMNNFLHAMANKLKPQPSDKLLAVTSLSFDIAVLELFLPLYCGAQVVIGHESLSLDGAALKHHLAAQQITLMQATPVSWKMLLASGWQQTTPLTVLCGGEAFPTELAQQLLAQPALRVWNMYGPTETTVWSAMHCLSDACNSSDLPDSLAPVPIGKPIANTQIYIVSSFTQQVGEQANEHSNKLHLATLSPIGVTGELCIGGAGLAKGYLEQADLTAEKFVQAHIPTTSGELHPTLQNTTILYRTGDLARYQQDGTLVCLGRIDSQVKVRGFRIELGEIETRLAQHEQVGAAAVSVQAHQGASVLVAYVVLAQDSENTELQSNLQQHLSKYLQQQLPDYMLPSGFMILDQLPLTPNGKVDKKALPAFDFSANANSNSNAFVAPRTNTEAQLAAIWQDLLGVEKVGVEDNFFQLGGHSLLAARLRVAIETEFERDIALMDLFEHQTIASLASLIDQTEEQFAQDDVDWMASLMDEMEE